MMQHFIQSYLRRVFVTEHNHPQRIADQDNVEAAFIEQTRGWIIVGSQRRDALAALLHFTKFFSRVHSAKSRRVELLPESPGVVETPPSNSNYHLSVRRIILAGSGNCASSSPTLFVCPGKRKSGAMSHNGCSTNLRSVIRGCGNCNIASSRRSLPQYNKSRSIVRETFRSWLRSLPRARSISWSASKSASADFSNPTSITAL